MSDKKSYITEQANKEDGEPAVKVARHEYGDAVVISDITTSTNCQNQKHLALPQQTKRTLSNEDELPGGVNITSTQEHKNQASCLNTSLLSSDIQTVLHRSYKEETDFFDGTTGVKLCCSPFRHCVMPDFITDVDYISALESVLLDLPLIEKNNDLYKFNQSEDLNHSASPALSLFRSLCDDIKTFLSNVTEIPLNSKIDLFCSHYRYTDVLLCHDDELEERRIAFIYYLVPEQWSLSDGGTLDLFDADEYGQPKDIVKSIVPKRNSFLFFEVSAASFHQVAEVLTEGMTRLSISGWFHGPPLRRPPVHVDTLPPAVPYGSIEEEVFYAWVNPLYLAPEIQTDIKKRFEEDSEIELTDFLQEDKYLELTAALQEEHINWTKLGPANKRNYHSAVLEQLPSVVSEFLQVIHSDAAFLVLSNLTGLKLHPLAHSGEDNDAVNGALGESSTSAAAGNPRCRSEVRRWEHGCYTLAHDTDTEILDFALDTMMYIGCNKEWVFDNGGYTSYIAKGEEDELLSVCPSRNSLALVYRDKDTMRFVKHLNHRVTELSPPRYFDVSTVYYE